MRFAEVCGALFFACAPPKYEVEWTRSGEKWGTVLPMW